MKNVLANDEIAYRRDKGYYGINLGGLTANELGFPIDETPKYTFISSSKLPSTATKNRFYFNKNISILDNSHASVEGREYIGNLYRLETKGIEKKQEEIKAVDVQLYHTGKGAAKFQTALAVSNTVNGTDAESAGGKIYGITATARTIANANVDKLVGVWGYVNNIIPASDKAKVKQMIGVESEVNSSHPGSTGTYSSVDLGSLFGFKTDVTNNPNSSTSNMKGLQTFLTFQANSHITGRVAGVDAYALINGGSNIKEYSSIVSNIDNISNAATVGSLHGMRLYNNIHKDSQITNMYGIKIESVRSGKVNNYSIFTDAGQVRFGDNVGILVDNPKEKLEVAGAIKLSNSTDNTCDDTKAGTIRFVATAKKFQGCTGDKWVDLH